MTFDADRDMPQTQDQLEFLKFCREQGNQIHQVHHKNKRFTVRKLFGYILGYISFLLVLSIILMFISENTIIESFFLCFELSVVVAVSLVLLYLFLVAPWHYAKINGHPNPNGVFILSVLGIVTFGVFWIIAVAWAVIGSKK